MSKEWLEDLKDQEEWATADMWCPTNDLRDCYILPQAQDEHLRAGGLDIIRAGNLDKGVGNLDKGVGNLDKGAGNLDKGVVIDLLQALSASIDMVIIMVGLVTVVCVVTFAVYRDGKEKRALEKFEMDNDYQLKVLSGHDEQEKRAHEEREWSFKREMKELEQEINKKERLEELIRKDPGGSHVIEG
jgi:hypothetical protein